MCQSTKTLNVLTKLNITSSIRRWTQVPPFLKMIKFSILSQFVKKITFEISRFNEQNHFITKAYAWRNSLMQKWTLFLRDSGRYGSACQNLPHHPMQVLVNFENGGTCIHRRLLDTMYWTMLNRLMVWFADIFAYLGMQKELWDCLWLWRKMIKTKWLVRTFG